MKKKMSKSFRSNLITYGMVTALFVIMFILQSVGALSSSLSGQLVPICAYIVMAVSLNLTVGVLGELSLGHAGFMSVGAFSGVVAAGCMGGSSPVLNLIVGIVVGGVFAAVFGVIVGVPVLRLHGDYLAIVTLAFGEIIKNIVNCLYIGVDSAGLHLSFTDEASLNLLEGGKTLLNGPQGASGITKLSTFLAGFILIIVTLFVVINLVNSRAGRAIMALRDNRIAAESVGIPITKYKLMAFITSAALAGMAGALFALNYSTVSASKFNFNTSILVLVFVVLGGMGNIRGSIISATVLTILPELLRGFDDYRMLIYAIVLILVMIFSNNPTIKRYFDNMADRFKGIFKKNAKGGAVK